MFKTFDLTAGLLRWDHFNIWTNFGPNFWKGAPLALIGVGTSFERQIKGFLEGFQPIEISHYILQKNQVKRPL